jgi:hypothetical protein
VSWATLSAILTGVIESQILSHFLQVTLLLAIRRFENANARMIGVFISAYSNNVGVRLCHLNQTAERGASKIIGH